MTGDAMNGAAPWAWRVLEANEARATWRALTEFVDWLVERYELGDLVPACWWAHGAITEELTALWASWVAAYLDADADPDAPLVWHERLAALRERLADWDRLGCASRGHRAGAPARFDPDAEAFAAFVEADCAARPGPHRLHTLEGQAPADGATDDVAMGESATEDEPC